MSYFDGRRAVVADRRAAGGMLDVADRPAAAGKLVVVGMLAAVGKQVAGDTVRVSECVDGRPQNLDHKDADRRTLEPTIVVQPIAQSGLQFRVRWFWEKFAGVRIVKDPGPIVRYRRTDARCSD